MGEQAEVFGNITIGDELFPVTRKNLFINRFLGAHAVYDHCYIKKPNGGGGYIWSYNPVFDRYVELAHQHQAQITLNIEQPSDNLTGLYISHATEDLIEADTIPAEWFDSETDTHE